MMQEDFGLISIIMAAYNTEKTIEQAINSVLSQTYTNFELLVVNDCSTDRTAELVKSIAAKDSRVRLISNVKNSGVSYTRKHGLEEAKGSWIAILDSDDAWAPEKLEKQIDLQRRTNADLLFTSSAFMDSEGHPIDWYLRAPSEVTYRQLLKQNVLSNSSALVRKELYAKNYAVGDEMHEDFAIWLSILKEGKKAYGVDEPLLIYSNFYPGALEYEDVSQEEWDAQNQIDVMTIKPAHVVKLMHSSYGNSYVTVYQPYVNTAGRLCGAMTVLIKEKDVVSMFLSQQQWREEGLFCLISDDGTVLAGNNYDGTTLSLTSDDTGWETYQGKRYLMATRYVASLNATAVIGMPPSLYEAGLLAVQRAICLYLIVGVLGCVLISVCMTLEDMNSLRPMLDTLDESDLASRKVLNEIFLRNVNSQHELARELEHSRSELEHGKMEILLRTGSVSQETLQQLTDAVQLKAYNFLLLIPSLQENAECSLKEELRTVVVSEQIRQIYGQRFYVQATADDLILVILTQETDEAEELREMCFRTEQLYDALHLTTPLILSDPFEKMEQLSDIYWKARNVAAYADPTQKICYLGNSSAQRGTTVNATNAARLREYLLSGCTEEAVSLLSELFSVDNLDPENFKQDFYTAGGILLNTAERVCCPDIAYLCSYDSKLTARQMLSRLQDCCVEICNHVQFLKHSHNDALQKNILDWLAQNFQNPEINAAMTAEQFKISKKYLSQFLKEQTGKSYTEYVEELRLDHAMQLLRTTDLNITDIAEQCGFSTANTFYKAFRRKYQLSPSAVRKGDN